MQKSSRCVTSTQNWHNTPPKNMAFRGPLQALLSFLLLPMIPRIWAVSILFQYVPRTPRMRLSSLRQLKPAYMFCARNLWLFPRGRLYAWSMHSGPYVCNQATDVIDDPRRQPSRLRHGLLMAPLVNRCSGTSRCSCTASPATTQPHRGAVRGRQMGVAC